MKPESIKHLQNADLSELGDVDCSGMLNGEVLTWNSGTSKWENATSAAGTTLAALTDTTISGPANTEVLQYNGSAWVNAAAPGGGDVSDGDTLSTGLTFPNTGLHILDSDASHDLIVKPGSNLTADRELTVTTGDAARTLDISAADVTITTAGAALLDDANAAAQRTTLGVDAAGTDNAPTASDTVSGKVELATSAETNTGTDATRAVTPDGLDDWTGSAQLVTSGITYCETIALSDNTTALTTGVKATTYSPTYAITITDVEAWVLTAPTGAELIVDIHDDGTTIMATDKLDIEVSEFHTKDAATQPAVSAGSIAANSKLEFEIDQVGSTIAGAGLMVRYYYTID